MKLKKVICVLISIIILTTCTFAFSDLPKEHWAYETVNTMKNAGIISGFEDGTFRPNATVTREEFATILSKYFSWLEVEQQYQFDDVKNDRWSKEYINKASQYLNIYESGGKKYFKPAEPACRRDAIIAIVKALYLPENQANLYVLDKFADSDKIDGDIKQYIALAVQTSIITGNSDNTLNLDGKLTRAEVCAMMWRAMMSTRGIIPSKSKETVKCVVTDGNNIPAGYCNFDIYFSTMPTQAWLIIDDGIDREGVEIDISTIKKNDTQYIGTSSVTIYSEKEHQVKASAYFGSNFVVSDAVKFTVIPPLAPEIGQEKGTALPLRADKSYDELTELNGKKPYISLNDYGQIGLYLGKISENKIKSVYDVITEINCIRGLLNIEDSRYEFIPEGEDGVLDKNSYVIWQVYKGIPVMNTNTVVSVDKDGYISSILNRYKDSVRFSKINVEPTILREEAKGIAQNYLRDKGKKFENISVDDLAIEESMTLVWTISENDFLMYINAHTGEVILYNETHLWI